MLSIGRRLVVIAVAAAAIAGCGGTEPADDTGQAGSGGSAGVGGGGTAGTGGGGTGGIAGGGGEGGSAGTGGSGGMGGEGGSTGPICGDGTREGDEQCDDGNTTADDGCSPTCTFEATCGNGAIEGDEACDGADLGGATCADFGHNSGTLTCTGTCALDASACATVEFCGNGTDDDGDTLADCDDADCVNDPACPRCGDGVINGADEDCDGNAVPVACTDLGYAAGVSGCTEFCLIDTSACIPPEDCSTPGDEDGDDAADCEDSDCALAFGCPSCGNGVIQQGEECEGSVPPGTSCATFGFNAGTLRCDPVECVFDTQFCRNVEDCSTPGDEDGDGAADCADSDCYQRPPCPVCGNGVVEAGEACDDGNTANGDGCSQWCRDVEPIPAAGATVAYPASVPTPTATWARPTTNDTTFACTAGTTQKRYQTWRFQNPGTLPARIKVSLGIERAFASLYIYRGTFDPLQPMAGCYGKSGGSSLNTASWFLDNYLLAPGEIVTVVVSDGTQVNYPIADYTLTVETRSICGDAEMTGAEPCDDGNGVDGDGCSATCMREYGWACNPYFTPQCHPTVCGDSLLEGDEQCDDGNALEGDLCSATCLRAGISCAAPMYMANKWDPAQSAWIWSGTTDFLPDHTASCASSAGPDGVASFTAPTTGDYYFSYFARNFAGVMALYSGTCGLATSEIACIPQGSGSYQITTRHMNAGETVFVLLDGNASSAAYQFTLLIKRFTCGNGLVEAPAETCDDFNAVDGDGCSSVCQLEVWPEREPNDTPPASPRLGAYRLASGAIDPVSDVDFFSFVGIAGTPYRVTVFHTAADQCFNALLGRGDPILTIYDDNGQQVAQNNDINPLTQKCSDLTFTPAATGNFYAEVRSAAPGAGIAEYYLKIR